MDWVLDHETGTIDFPTWAVSRPLKGGGGTEGINTACRSDKASRPAMQWCNTETKGQVPTHQHTFQQAPHISNVWCALLRIQTICVVGDEERRNDQKRVDEYLKEGRPREDCGVVPAKGGLRMHCKENHSSLP